MTTTLFAGAGLSRAVSERVQYHDNAKLRMPLADEMLDNDSARDYLTQEQFRHTYGQLSDYLFKEYKGNRTPHISYEKVYSDLQHDRLGDVAEQLEGMIFEILGGNFSPIRYDTEVRQTIRIIRSLLCTHSITNIISTNPDILLEVAVMGSTQFNVDFIKILGIVNLSLCRPFPKTDPVLSQQKGMIPLNNIDRLVKLHGSLLLLKSKRGNGMYAWPDKYVWEMGTSHVKYTQNNQYELCVIPPINNKGIYYDIEPYKMLLEAAIAILRDTDVLIFFGFGFDSDNDAVLSRNMQDILHGTNVKIQHIIVYDKDHGSKKDEFRARVSKFLGRDDIDIRMGIL